MHTNDVKQSLATPHKLIALFCVSNEIFVLAAILYCFYSFLYSLFARAARGEA